MTLRLKQSSSLRDWVSLPAEALRERGLDHSERRNRTGHIYPLGDLWLCTVGCWCIGDTVSIKEHVPYIEKRTFDTYKQRHKLRTFPQFRSRYGDKAWALPEVLFFEFGKIQKRRGFSSYGEPAKDLGAKIGVLPIEVVVYITMFQEFLDLLSIDKREWQEMDDDGKDQQWNRGRDIGGGDFHAIFDRPCIDWDAGPADGLHGKEARAAVP